MPYNIGDKLNNKYWSGENYGWQSKATHEKLKEEGKFRLGTQAIDRVVSSGMDWATQNIPGVVSAVNTGLKTVGGVVNFTAEQLNKSAAGRAVVSTAGAALEAYDQALETVSEVTNIDKRVVGLTTDIAVGAVTGGSGTAAKLSTQAATGVAKTVKRGISLVDDVLPPPTGLAPALAGGAPIPAPQLKPAFQNGVLKLTVTKPERIAEGVVEGVAKSPQFAPQVTRWQKRWDITKSRLDNWINSTESAKVKSRNIKKSRDVRYGKVSTGMSRVDDIADEMFYETMPALGKERHHLFPKAESYQFVKRLKQLIDDGVADMDDMVNLFLYAEDAGTVMGNRKANMLLMEKLKEHGGLHRMRETTEGALGLKMEPKTQDLFVKLSEAKNADELMDMFDEYLQLNIKPSKRAAFEKTIKQNRQLLSTLTETQRRRL